MNEFQRVNGRAKAMWFVMRLIGFLILGFFSALIFLFSQSAGLKIAAGVVLFLQLLNMVIYPFVEYIQWSYLVNDDRIEIKKGIIWHSHTIIPISRIQNVSTTAGPLQRIFRLSTVTISTAGSNCAIKQLAPEVAAQMCETLEHEIQHRLELMLSAEQARLDKMAEEALLDIQDAEV